MPLVGLPIRLRRNVLGKKFIYIYAPTDVILDIAELMSHLGTGRSLEIRVEVYTA